MNQLNVLSFHLTSQACAPHSLDWGQTEAFTFLLIQSHCLSETLRHSSPSTPNQVGAMSKVSIAICNLNMH